LMGDAGRVERGVEDKEGFGLGLGFFVCWWRGGLGS
jgi:hypothetical protein